ncbi:MAG: metallophosphoesterase [Armatimonadota bacterium]
MPRSLSRVVLCLAALLAALPAFAAPTITKGPYLQNVRTNSVVIMWETSESSDARIQYGPTTSYGQTISNSTLTRLHEITLSGLTTDTAYHYKVTSVGSTGTVASADAVFRTAVGPATPFRFAAYGDSRTFATAHAAVVRAMVASAPRLVLHTGDLTRDGTVSSYWQTEYFDPAKPLIPTTPVYPTIGNHEKGTAYYYSYFSTPAGGGTKSEQWYSFNYGNVHFISLDTCGSYGVGTTQYNWLVNDLRAATAEWKVVLTHYPAYSSGTHGGSSTVQNVLVPLFEQHHVDMVFAGHDHIYERSLKNGVYYFVTGGGGAELYSINQTSNPYRQFSKAAYHHITVDVSGNTATIKARGNDGVAFDSVTLTHPKPPIADFSATPTSGTAPCTVYFTDLSTNAPTSWRWSFGDGGASTTRSPSHQYTAAGSYTVSLTAANAYGSDSETKSGYVSVSAISPSCHIGAITLANLGPPRFRARATVAVHDQSCRPLAGAAVTISWSGGVTGSATAVSDANGNAIFVSPRSFSPTDVTCSVVNLAKSGYRYEPSSNHQTSAHLALRVVPMRKGSPY